MPSSVHSERPTWGLIRWFFLTLAIATLGYVSFSFLDANAFQTYQKWRMRQAHPNSRQPVGKTELRALPTSLPTSGEVRHSAINLGSVLGRIDISRIGVSVIVVEGDNGRTLRRAVGHVPGTALPGERGNVAITGHRDTFFRPLRNIRKDDEITLTTLDGSYRYQVESTKVVAADDTE